MRRNQEIHLSDQEILCFCDGELSSSESTQVRSHLEACWTCRSRMKEVEGTIGDFVRLHHTELDSQLPSADRPRALLRARLAEAAVASSNKNWRGRVQSVISVRAVAYAGIVLVATFVLGTVVRHREIASRGGFRAPVVPDRALTPGATRPVNRADICAAGYRDMNREVPASVQQEVFRNYGMTGARTDQYEVDYLITPELGGSDDIRNLWPEPYSAKGWDAHVKDELEDRLHEMVCDGKIDLGEAQREMAGDWISAYKKYFHKAI